MTYAAIFVEEELEEDGIRSTHKAAIIGRFTYKNKSTMEKHTSKAAFQYLAKSFLQELLRAEGKIDELTNTQLQALDAHKKHFEELEHESIEITDFEYMSS